MLAQRDAFDSYDGRQHNKEGYAIYNYHSRRTGYVLCPAPCTCMHQHYTLIFITRACSVPALCTAKRPYRPGIRLVNADIIIMLRFQCSSETRKQYAYTCVLLQTTGRDCGHAELRVRGFYVCDNGIPLQDAGAAACRRAHSNSHRGHNLRILQVTTLRLVSNFSELVQDTMSRGRCTLRGISTSDPGRTVLGWMLTCSLLLFVPMLTMLSAYVCFVCVCADGEEDVRRRATPR